MGTRLSPTCDECGLRSDEVPEGVMVWPDLTTLCMRCHEPDAEKRQEMASAMIKDAIALFRQEHGRLPEGAELIKWLDGNVGGERGRLHLIGAMPGEDAD